MKRTTAVVALLFGSLAGSDLLAQGQFQWGNVLGGFPAIIAPIYGVDPNNPTEVRRGNTATGTPLGTQTYAGTLLGTGHTAAIFVGRTAAEVMANNTPPQLLGTALFRNNAQGAPTGRLATGGFTAVAYGIPQGTPNVHYQFRAWDNMGGTVTSWVQVMAAGGTIPSGQSEILVFSLPAIGTPPLTDGIRSFQLTVVPEPSLLALGALALGALLLRRRR